MNPLEPADVVFKNARDFWCYRSLLLQPLSTCLYNLDSWKARKIDDASAQLHTHTHSGISGKGPLI